MKKTIYSLVALALISTGTLTFTACNSDDSSPEPTPTPQVETLKISADETTVTVGETVTLTATLGEKDVTSEATFYKDEVAITGNTITSNEAGSFLVMAKYPNAKDSEYITVTFEADPFDGIEGTGNFVYDGTTYNLTGSYLRLRGFYYANEEETEAVALWWQVSWDTDRLDTAENLAAVSFITPATLAANGTSISDYVTPDQNQNEYDSILGIMINGEDKITEEYTDGTGVITYNALDLEAAPNTADFDIEITGGQHPLKYTYKGAILSLQGKTIDQSIKSFAQYKIDKAALSKTFKR